MGSLLIITLRMAHRLTMQLGLLLSLIFVLFHVPIGTSIKLKLQTQPLERGLWRSDNRCGPLYPLNDGTPSQCRWANCCSYYGWCGNSNYHCSCPGCISFSQRAKMETEIRDFANGYLMRSNIMDLRAKMMTHFKSMKLMDANGNWAHSKFVQIQQELAPAFVQMGDFSDLIEDMASAIVKNQYVVNFYEWAKIQGNYPVLRSKIQSEGQAVFSDVLAFAMVLEKLNQAQYKDYEVTVAVQDVWKEKNSIAVMQPKYKTEVEQFVLAKLLLVREAADRTVAILRKGTVEPTFGRSSLSFNIGIAAQADYGKGFNDNGFVGMLLAKYPGGESVLNPATGSGPSTVSRDGRTLQRRYPLPRLWDDLYLTWNLAFGTYAGAYPFFFAKLLIPSVSGYHSKPEDFLFHRVNAINTFENWWNNAPSIYKDMNWIDGPLTLDWGRMNKESAMSYAQRVAEATGTTAAAIINKPTPDFTQDFKIFACGGPTKFPCDLRQACASSSAMAWLCKM